MVWTDVWPGRNWICSNSPSARWHRRAQVLLRSCSQIRDFSLGGRRLDDVPDRLRCDSVPQTFSSRFTRRKIGPSPTAATLTQSSTARFAHAGTGTVRMCFPLPIRSATTQYSSRARSRFPRIVSAGRPCSSFLDCSTASQLPIWTPRRLRALHSENACGKFWTQQACVSGLVRKPVDGGQPHIDGGGSGVVLLQENLYRSNGPVEGQSWFRAVPADEFVDLVAVGFLGTRSR
jgi:hypothetical protein